MGTIFNEYTHKLMTVFNDYTMVNGISYGLAENKVYYPAVANGSISEAIFYSTSVIRNITAKRIIRLSNVKEVLTVHTKNELKFVIAQDSGIGEFLFAIQDGAGYGIENREAVFESPDGVFILTKQGIFLTTPQDDVLLSEPINDIIEDNYESGGLVYDSKNKELWFYVIGTDEIYVYSFVHRKWASRDIIGWDTNTGTGIIERIFVNQNGEIIVLVSGSLFKAYETTFGTAIVGTHEVDFGDIESWKQFQYQMVDYEGTVKFGDEQYSSGSRTEQKFPITVDIRYPVKKISTSIRMINASKLYAIEYSYDLVYTIR
jgi:hypothetical protein